MPDTIILNQGAIGLTVLLVCGVYLLAILIPLSARASMRSRLLLGTGFFAKFLSGLLFSVPGIVFNVLVLLLAMGGAFLWVLEPIPRLQGVEAVAEQRVRQGSDHLVVFIGGWNGAPSDRRLVELLARDKRLEGADLLVVDYVQILADRRPGLIELAQAMHAQVHGRLTEPRYRAVVLIGHSVGGLLARWWAAPEPGGKPPPVAALIDLAVPKVGADLPALATALGLPAELLAVLDDKVGFTGAALQRWRGLGAASGFVYCFYGTRDTAVPRDSAFAGCARRHDEIDADHRTIAAPESDEVLAYRRAMELIAESLSRATAR